LYSACLTEQPCALAVTCRRHDEEEEDESDAMVEHIFIGLHGNEACLHHHHEFFLLVKLGFVFSRFVNFWNDR